MLWLQVIFQGLCSDVCGLEANVVPSKAGYLGQEVSLVVGGQIVFSLSCAGSRAHLLSEVRLNGHPKGDLYR